MLTVTVSRIILTGLPLPVARIAYRLPGPRNPYRLTGGARNPYRLTGPELSYRLPGHTYLTSYCVACRLHTDADTDTDTDTHTDTCPHTFQDTFWTLLKHFLDTFETLSGHFQDTSRHVWETFCARLEHVLHTFGALSRCF